MSLFLCTGWTSFLVDRPERTSIHTGTMCTLFFYFFSCITSKVFRRNFPFTVRETSREEKRTTDPEPALPTSRPTTKPGFPFLVWRSNCRVSYQSSTDRGFRNVSSWLVEDRVKIWEWTLSFVKDTTNQVTINPSTDNKCDLGLGLIIFIKETVHSKHP